MGTIRIGNKTYNIEKSIFLCHTPQGDLYRKKSGSTEFYLYHPNGKTAKEKITSLSWPEANNLVKTYGTREQYLELFTTYGKSTDQNKSGNTVLLLDAYHRIKAQRNADRLGLSMTAYIKRLIDKDDANRNY